MQTTGDTISNGCLVAVVVTYNRLSQLQKTLAALLALPSAYLTAVVVVDNACTDGTEAWLADQTDPRLVVHRCLVNGGGAGGFEIGMRLAADRWDPDWLLLMDDDARPIADALARFHSNARSEAEVWAAAVFHPDGRICDMNRPSVNPFWHPKVMLRTLLGGGRSGFHLGPSDYETTAPCAIDTASFVGLFVSRAAIRRVGYPDGSLFLYGDDVLYTLGLSRAGGRILFDPALRFEHDFSTMSEQERRFRPVWKSYYHYRNLLMVYRVASGPFFVFVAPAAAAKWLLKFRFHHGERRLFVAYVLRALRDGLLRRTNVSHEAVVALSETRQR